ncbi:uncharacterized protein LOC141499387 [Macrotis lagotis]|uniref:uncharacterized protein LOC141499387 n=1 Tax=Macrotis lagotis TaxID=92651 RepID=UPI003D682161
MRQCPDAAHTQMPPTRACASVSGTCHGQAAETHVCASIRYTRGCAPAPSGASSGPGAGAGLRLHTCRLAGSRREGVELGEAANQRRWREPTVWPGSGCGAAGSSRGVTSEEGAPSGGMERSGAPSDPKTQNVLKKPSTGSWRANWGRHETNLLLEAIFKTGKAHQIISGTSQRKSKLWREITETLSQRHAGYTAEQCRTKWKHLKSQFRFEQARYLATGTHSDPLPHFYDKMNTLWNTAAGGTPKSGPPKRPKRSSKGKLTQELQKQKKKAEIPAQIPAKHSYNPDPDKPEELPGTLLQPPQAVTSISEPQSKDSEASNVTEGVDENTVNQPTLGRQPGEETVIQQEKPQVPRDLRSQQIEEAMLEELRNLSRNQQEISVVNMYIAKVLQCQQEQLIPGIHLLNHNMYHLCLLLGNHPEAPLHPGPFFPQMINSSILFSGSEIPQPCFSTFEQPGAPHPK